MCLEACFENKKNKESKLNHTFDTTCDRGNGSHNVKQSCFSKKKKVGKMLKPL